MNLVRAAHSVVTEFLILATLAVDASRWKRKVGTNMQTLTRLDSPIKPAWQQLF